MRGVIRWLIRLSTEMFGFKVNPVAAKMGEEAKNKGRPIYLDMQVSASSDDQTLLGLYVDRP